MQIFLEKILIPKNPLTRRRKSSDEVQNLLKGPIKVLHDTYRICARVRRLPRAHYKQPAWGVIEKQTQTLHLFFHTWKILNDLPATLIKHFRILIFRLCLYFFFHFSSPPNAPPKLIHQTSSSTPVTSFFLFTLTLALLRRLTWQECLSYHICRHKAIRKNMPSTHSLPSPEIHLFQLLSRTHTLTFAHQQTTEPRNNHFHSQSRLILQRMRGESVNRPSHVSQT